MTTPKALDPVDEVPTIKRDVDRRRSKYDRLLDEVVSKHEQVEDRKEWPYEYPSKTSAQAARRRIIARASLHERDITARQRENVVYVRVED